MVPTPTRSFSAIARQEAPEARRASTLDSSTSRNAKAKRRHLGCPRVSPAPESATFQLCHSADDLEHEPAGRRAQVQAVAQADEGQFGAQFSIHRDGEYRFAVEEPKTSCTKEFARE